MQPPPTRVADAEGSFSRPNRPNPRPGEARRFRGDDGRDGGTVADVEAVAPDGSNADDGAGPFALPLVSQHGLRQRRRRERMLQEGHDAVDGDGERNVAALFQGYGTHYVDLWVGTPPQRQTVIVDTGSVQTAFPCSACEDCGESYHTDSRFVEAESSTFERLECDACHEGSCARGRAEAGSSGRTSICRVSNAYSEGSRWSAYEARDWAYAGGTHSGALSAAEAEGAGRFPLTFGCQTLLTKLFLTQLADGIMGMGNRGASYWSQMYDGGALPERSFSLCFARQPTASREGTAAGALTLGGADGRFHATPMAYARSVDPDGVRYKVHVKSIYLREGGGESAGTNDAEGGRYAVHPLGETNSDHSAIVDSGTTLTYLDKTIGTALKVKWEEITGMDYSNDPVKLTDEQLHSLPTMLFQLEASDDGANGNIGDGTEEPVVGLTGAMDESNPTDVIVAMPASHYMYYDEEKDTYENGIYIEKKSGSILGANWMAGHDILFDVGNGRIGIAESGCDYFFVTGRSPPETQIRASSREANLVCPTTGCKMGVLAVVSVLHILFIIYRRRYGGSSGPTRRDRQGTAAVPTADGDLEPYQKEDAGVDDARCNEEECEAPSQDDHDENDGSE